MPKCDCSTLEVFQFLEAKRKFTEVSVVDVVKQSFLDAFNGRNSQHQGFMFQHTVDIQTCTTMTSYYNNNRFFLNIEIKI